MMIYNLKLDNPNYNDDYQSAVFFYPGFENLNEGKPLFLKKWLNAQSTLAEWIKNPGFDFEKVEKNAELQIDVYEKIEFRRKWMYNCLIEFKVQYQLANRLFYVIQTTPCYALNFAQKEMDLIDLFISNSMDDLLKL